MVTAIGRKPETNGHESYAPQLHTSQRRQMLREVLYHQEAQNRSEWEQPPIQPGENLSSYADMMLDPQVCYAVSLIKEAILAEHFQVKPAENASKGGAAMALDVENNLRDIDIEAALEDALNATWRGFWAHEITWRHGQRQFWLDKLAAIDPDQVTLQLDEHMRVTAVVSKPMSGHAEQRVPNDKLWLHMHRPSRTKPAGESILDAAYRAWSSKNRLLQFWGLSIQRWGMRQWQVTVPANTSPTRQAQILTTAQAGRLDGVYMWPEDVQADALDPVQWANLTYEQAITYQDSEISKAILLLNPPGSTATGQSYVTGQGIDAMNRATAFRLARISRALESSFKRQVIDPLCFANWGAAPAQCPQLVLSAPDPARIVALAPALSQLVSAGVTDRAVAADQLGLPEPKEQPPSKPGTTPAQQSK